MSVKVVSNANSNSAAIPQKQEKTDSRTTQIVMANLQQEQAKTQRQLNVGSVKFDPSFISQLTDAASRNELSKVKMLLNQIPLKDPAPEYFEAASNALAEAAGCGYRAICEELLNYVAYPIEAAKRALAKGHHEILQLIFAHVIEADEGNKEAAQIFIIDTVAEKTRSPGSIKVAEGYLNLGQYRNYNAYKEAAKNGCIEALKLVMGYVLDPTLFTVANARYERERIKQAVAQGTMLGDHADMIHYAVESHILSGDVLAQVEVALSAGANAKAEGLCATIPDSDITKHQNDKIPRIFYRIFRIAVFQTNTKVIEKFQPVMQLSDEKNHKTLRLACQKCDPKLIEFLLKKEKEPKNIAFQMIHWMARHWVELRKMPNALESMDVLLRCFDAKWLKTHKKPVTDLATKLVLHPKLIFLFEKILPFIELNVQEIFSNAAEGKNISAFKLYFKQTKSEFGARLQLEVDIEDPLFGAASILKYLLNESANIFEKEEFNPVQKAQQRISINAIRYLLTKLYEKRKEDLKPAIDNLILAAVFKQPKNKNKEYAPLFLQMIKDEFYQKNMVYFSDKFLQKVVEIAKFNGNNLSAALLESLLNPEFYESKED